MSTISDGVRLNSLIGRSPRAVSPCERLPHRDVAVREVERLRRRRIRKHADEIFGPQPIDELLRGLDRGRPPTTRKLSSSTARTNVRSSGDATGSGPSGVATVGSFVSSGGGSDLEKSTRLSEADPALPAVDPDLELRRVQVGDRQGVLADDLHLDAGRCRRRRGRPGPAAAPGRARWRRRRRTPGGQASFFMDVRHFRLGMMTCDRPRTVAPLALTVVRM